MRVSEQKLVASIVRESFYDFLKEFWTQIIQETPVFNWHVKYLCDELQQVAERVFKGEEKQYDLIINVPPGSTKSTICSQMFPAWAWTRMTHAQFLHVSYAHTVATKDALKCRDLVISELYRGCFPEVKLREDQNSKERFQNTKGGWRQANGMEGQITGNHAHFIIVDDPIDPNKAVSDLERLRANRVMMETLPSRTVNRLVTPLILIQQRLHQADPTGEMLERQKGDRIRHICIPGELTPDVKPPELAKFYVDGLFDIVRMPQKVLVDLKPRLGAYGYASQILQSPVPPEGGLFDVSKLNYVKEEPPDLVFVGLVRSWDKAGTQDGGAYTVGTLMGRDKKDRYWVLDVKREQLSSFPREDLIDKTADEDDTLCEVVLEIEGGSGGKESGERTVKMLAGHRVHTYHPTGDKEARAFNFSVEMGNGNVYVLERHWTAAWVEEFRFFPFSRFKDQVDSGGAAYNRLALKKKKRVGGLWSVSTG